MQLYMLVNSDENAIGNVFTSKKQAQAYKERHNLDDFEIEVLLTERKGNE